jgi:hypothetical protein
MQYGENMGFRKGNVLDDSIVRLIWKSFRAAFFDIWISGKYSDVK